MQFGELLNFYRVADHCGDRSPTHDWVLGRIPAPLYRAQHGAASIVDCCVAVA
jgi:hypothetical protein